MVGVARRCGMLWGMGERLRSRSFGVDVKEFWSKDRAIVRFRAVGVGSG